MYKVYEKPLQHEEEYVSAGIASRVVLAAGLIGATLLQTNPGICENALNVVARDVSACPDDPVAEPVYSDMLAMRNLVRENDGKHMKSNKYTSDVDAVNRWRADVEKYANDTVDTELVMILLDLESKGDPEAVSHAGAQGLLQIMPTTAPDIAERLGVSEYNMLNPETNIRFAVEHIRWLIEDVGVTEKAGDMWPLYVAASYNFGHGAAALISSGNFEQLPEETRNYALNTQRLYEQLES